MSKATAHKLRQTFWPSSWKQPKSEDYPRLNRTRTSTEPLDLEFQPDIPVASVVEMQLEHYEERDWRNHFASKLSGLGLEIGPLHRPLGGHPGMKVEYIDRHSVADLRKLYPELGGLALVEADYIGDAETLSVIPDAKYDFLVSAHVIEHMRNPIEALKQWFRVLKPGGFLYLIVPDKRITFDSRRARTTLPHIIHDYIEPSLERDFEHYLDYAIFVNNADTDMALYEARRLQQIDYSIHYHVFLPTDMFALLCWFSFNVLGIDIIEGPCMSPGSDEFHFLLQLRK